MGNRQNWKSSLSAILRTHNGVRSNGRTASDKTQEKRSSVLFSGFRELRELGYRLDDVHSFRGKHIEVLAKHWEQTGDKPSTLQNKISIFRSFTGWIGKSGMVLQSDKYVSPGKTRRSSVNKIDKSWSAQGIDIASKIEDVRSTDARTAMQLELQHVFGLRVSESLQLRPHLADRGQFLAVNWGAKGGRDRVVGIETARQREVLDLAKTFAASLGASMCDPKYSLKQAKGHYYRVMEKYGITKAVGKITSHGLRHEKSNDRYCELTGVSSPVRGGKQVEPAQDNYARQVIAEELGHSRLHITTHYLGR